MADNIVIAVMRALKSQDRHQKKALMEKVLGNLDAIVVLKPEDGLMFCQGRLNMKRGDVENQGTQKFTRGRPMIRPPLQFLSGLGFARRRHCLFLARVRPCVITLRENRLSQGR
jgi:hypothetical protein